MASAWRRPEGFLRSNRREGAQTGRVLLISLSMSYSTRRIESVAPSIKRYDANLPTMICANRLAPAVLFSIGCAGLPAATHRCCDPCAAATTKYHQVTRRQVLGGSRGTRKLFRSRSHLRGSLEPCMGWSALHAAGVTRGMRHSNADAPNP